MEKNLSWFSNVCSDNISQYIVFFGKYTGQTAPLSRAGMKNYRSDKCEEGRRTGTDLKQYIKVHAGLLTT